MCFLLLVLCCLTTCCVSEGNFKVGVLGRNVTFSWTLRTVPKDDIYILHNNSRFWQVSPNKTISSRPVRVSVNYIMPDSVMVTVDFMNITTNDAGDYRLVRQWRHQDLVESIHLRTIEETMIPKISIVRPNSLESSLILECNISSTSTAGFLWSVNRSMIGSQGRYSQNNSCLLIRNLTADDQYSLYKCIESGSRLESDSYRIQISGPTAVQFAPNITMIQEHSGLNMSCLADCYPICSWKWTKLDASVGSNDVVATENALYIQNISRQDSGNYSCRVVNIVTGISLEIYTFINIVYGPDVITFNPSSKIIQLDETNLITITCSAECFPPCQTGWEETNEDVLITGREMKLVSIKKNSSFTCHATNARKDNSTISDTIYVIVKPEINYYTTKVMTSEENANEINYYTTKAMTSEENTNEFPSKLHLLSVLLGIGIICAICLLACLLRKLMSCFRMEKVSTNISQTDSNEGEETKTLREENQYGHYWTIISDADGELTSATETDFHPGTEQLLMGQNFVYIHNESEQPFVSDSVTVIVNEDIDGYLTPIHSESVQLSDYIHPVHSGPANTVLVSRHHSAEF